MSNQATISLLQQVEVTAEMLISQLSQVKNIAIRLREDLAGVSTPAVRKGSQILTDEQVAKLLVTRQKSRYKKSR